MGGYRRRQVPRVHSRGLQREQEVSIRSLSRMQGAVVVVLRAKELPRPTKQAYSRIALCCASGGIDLAMNVSFLWFLDCLWSLVACWFNEFLPGQTVFRFFDGFKVLVDKGLCEDKPKRRKASKWECERGAPRLSTFSLMQNRCVYTVTIQEAARCVQHMSKYR